MTARCAVTKASQWIDMLAHATVEVQVSQEQLARCRPQCFGHGPQALPLLKLLSSCFGQGYTVTRLAGC